MGLRTVYQSRVPKNKLSSHCHPTDGEADSIRAIAGLKRIGRHPLKYFADYSTTQRYYDHGHGNGYGMPEHPSPDFKAWHSGTSHSLREVDPYRQKPQEIPPARSRH
ncbi:hypothetical protein TNCV_756521 [Trichonephila clavipes]|nr:hypothetical protein TNCV_756521 [Trichonephila clavipes]